MTKGPQTVISCTPHHHHHPHLHLLMTFFQSAASSCSTQNTLRRINPVLSGLIRGLGDTLCFILFSTRPPLSGVQRAAVWSVSRASKEVRSFPVPVSRHIFSHFVFPLSSITPPPIVLFTHHHYVNSSASELLQRLYEWRLNCSERLF